MKNDIILFVAMFAVAWIGFKLINEQVLKPNNNAVAPVSDEQLEIAATAPTNSMIATENVADVESRSAAESKSEATATATDNQWDADDTGPRLQIKSMIRNRVDAWNARNVDRYMADYRNFDSLSVNFSGVEKNGWDKVYQYIRSEYEDDMGTLRLSDINIDVVDDKAAIVRANWNLTRSESIDSGRMSLVLNKVDSVWKITTENLSKR